MQRPRRRRESAVSNARRGGLPRAPFRPEGRSRQTANCKHTPTRKVTVRVANAYQSAPAAYRVTLVGAAVMSAGGRQAFFDSIPSLDGSLGDDRPVSSKEVGRHGHGRQGDLPYPVQCEAVQIRVRGRSETERRNLNLARRLMRPQKCGRVTRGNLD